MNQKKNAITPCRKENYPEWYQQVVKAADLAEHSAVRGCMVIKPWGYAIWENIQKYLDNRFKETGHKNAYFPLFIPLSYLEKEAQHVEGFAKECAVVTHHRLEVDSKGKLVPAGKLEEPLIVRPTSETIIGEAFSKWVQSYRDLPLLINQWCNIVRWEMRTRLFLRTAEFLWQEGHTVHASAEEALVETVQMLGVYAELAEQVLAIPVIRGEKTESERFPGAVSTLTLEMMMQDGKALQGGTSHFLGQNFAKASSIKFRDEKGNENYAWTTSWGFTTRSIGAMIMVHGDDDGAVLPPRVAPSHVVIIPIIHKEDRKASILEYCDALAKEIKKQSYEGRNVDVVIDHREALRGGEKVWEWIKKGIPLRIEVGPRDMEENKLGIARRDKPHKEYQYFTREEIASSIPRVLADMQKDLLNKARAFNQSHTHEIKNKKDFYDFFTSSTEEEASRGFALAHWAKDAEAEAKIKQDLNVTVRCIPLDAKEEEGKCVITGKKSLKKVVFAKAY